MPHSLSFTRALLLAMVVSLGIALAWLVVAAWTIGLVQVAMVGNQTYEHLYLGADGQPLIVRTTSARGAYTQEVFSLDREPIEGTQRHQMGYPGYMIAPQYTPAEGTAWSSRLVAASDGGSPAVNWYLVHDGRVNGRAYGVGYQSDSAEVVGYFGKQGFSDRQPPREQWFQVFGERGLEHVSTGVTVREPAWNQYQDNQGLVLLADGKVWTIDLAQRRLAALADCPDALAIGWLRPPHRVHMIGEPMDSAKLLVWQTDRLMILDRETGEHSSLALPNEVGPFLAVYEVPENRLLLISHDPDRVADGYRLAWLDRQGAVLQERVVRIASYRGARPGAASTAWAGAVAAPYPLASIFVAVVHPIQQVASGEANSFARALSETLREAWPAFLLVLVVSGIAATDAYRRQRHYALSHPLGWAAFVFLMGLPGWLAYRVHRTWPALESCRACHQLAPIDQAACPDCGVAVAPPALSGTEVFA